MLLGWRRCPVPRGRWLSMSRRRGRLSIRPCLTASAGARLAFGCESKSGSFARSHQTHRLAGKSRLNDARSQAKHMGLALILGGLRKLPCDTRAPGQQRRFSVCGNRDTNLGHDKKERSSMSRRHGETAFAAPPSCDFQSAWRIPIPCGGAHAPLRLAQTPSHRTSSAGASGRPLAIPSRPLTCLRTMCGFAPRVRTPPKASGPAAAHRCPATRSGRARWRR